MTTPRNFSALKYAMPISENFIPDIKMSLEHLHLAKMEWQKVYLKNVGEGDKDRKLLLSDIGDPNPF